VIVAEDLPETPQPKIVPFRDGWKQRMKYEVDGLIDDKPVIVQVDTGAAVSFISRHLAEQLKYPQKPIQEMFQLVDGKLSLETRAIVNVPLTVAGCTTNLDVYVSPAEHYGILAGFDWIEATRAIINSVDHTLELFNCRQEIPKKPEPESVPLLQLFEQPQQQAVHQIATIDESQVESLCQKWTQAFAENPKRPRTTEMDCHRIDTEGNPPVRSMPYRSSPAKRTKVRTIVQEMLDNGVIVPPILPIDVLSDRKLTAPTENIPELVSRLEKARNMARRNIDRVQKRMKIRYDARRRPPEFKQGQLVLKKQTRAPRNGRSKKLSIHWEGPYEIVEIRPPVNVVIKKIRGRHKTQTTHVDHLKPFHTRPHEDVSDQVRGECYEPHPLTIDGSSCITEDPV